MSGSERTCLPRGGYGSATLTLVAALLLAPRAAAAQIFQGRVIDQGNQPVGVALVRLVDEDGSQQAVTLADSVGLYRLAAPRPGTYRLQAARIGYRSFESPQLDAADRSGVHRLDLVLEAEPVALPGFTVEGERMSNRDADREIRRIIGLSVGSLRYRPIRLNEIQRHIEAGRALPDLLRWTNTVSLDVTYTRDGPCFSLRARGCLPVYLNGLQLNRDFMVDVPLDMVHSIVIISPGDGSLAFPSGAVLLYTEAWLR